jgi:hypothetical protein
LARFVDQVALRLLTRFPDMGGLGDLARSGSLDASRVLADVKNKMSSETRRSVMPVLQQLFQPLSTPSGTARLFPFQRSPVSTTGVVVTRLFSSAMVLVHDTLLEEGANTQEQMARSTDLVALRRVTRFLRAVASELVARSTF